MLEQRVKHGESINPAADVWAHIHMVTWMAPPVHTGNIVFHREHGPCDVFVRVSFPPTARMALVILRKSLDGDRLRSSSRGSDKFQHKEA